MLPPRRANPQLRGYDPDLAIRTTDTDASYARVSAVRKQYLHDPFISSLVPRAHLVPTRLPLINIGTYVRSEAIDELVLGWLKNAGADGKKVQIVSLGAGSDTRFWRLAAGQPHQEGWLQKRLARYVEVDFSEVTSAKVAAIQRHTELSSVIGEFTLSGASLTSPIFAIRDVDLRNFESVLPGFLVAGERTPSLLDATLPTLVLAECVLVYMDQTQSDALIEWFSDTFSVIGAIVYEMFGLNDSFGRVMKENLKLRNVSLPGVDAYPTLTAQSRRFTNLRFTSARSLTLREIRNEYIEAEELARIAKLELVDEIEELELLLGHYVITWAVRDVGPDSSLRISDSWGMKQKMREVGEQQNTLDHQI